MFVDAASRRVATTSVVRRIAVVDMKKVTYSSKFMRGTSAAANLLTSVLSNGQPAASARDAPLENNLAVVCPLPLLPGR